MPIRWWLHSVCNLYLCTLVLVLSLAAGCSRQSSSQEAEQESASANAPKQLPTQQLISTGEQILNQAAITTEQLLAGVEQLLASPSAETHRAVYQSWFSALRDIEAFYIFSLLKPLPASSPTDSGAYFANHYSHLASWPIEPGYLDGFAAHRFSGLVFDINFPISVASLIQQHGRTSAVEATLGIYALGALLFGDDGQRDANMFLPAQEISEEQREKGYTQTAELPANRRRLLVKTQASMLADSLARLRTAYTSKRPEDFAAVIDRLPPFQLLLMFNNASQQQFSEQALAVAQVQAANKTSSHEKSSWQNLLLAERLTAQLRSWTQLASILPLEGKEASQAEVSHSQKVLDEVILSSLDSADHPPAGNPWGTVFQQLRQLAARFNKNR